VTASLARAENLIDAMERLTEMFGEECAFIQAQDMGSVRALADRKQLLVRAYEDAAKTLRVDLEGFAQLDGAVKERLRLAALAFREAAERSASVLRAATSVRQSIVNNTVAAINKERAEESGYTVKRGVPIPAGYRRNAAIAPTALDTRL